MGNYESFVKAQGLELESKKKKSDNKNKDKEAEAKNTENADENTQEGADESETDEQS